MNMKAISKLLYRLMKVKWIKLLKSKMLAIFSANQIIVTYKEALDKQSKNDDLQQELKSLQDKV